MIVRLEQEMANFNNLSSLSDPPYKLSSLEWSVKGAPPILTTYRVKIVFGKASSIAAHTRRGFPQSLLKILLC